MLMDDEAVLATMRFYRLIQNLRAQELECQYQIRLLVEHARKEGMTWASIGEAVGTSTQAAWQRYAAPANESNHVDQPKLPIGETQ